MARNLPQEPDSPKTLRETAIALFQEIADLTRPECGKCLAPHSCCHETQCAFTINYARTHWGVTLQETGHPTLPLLDPLTSTCTALPHLRPLCSLHTCDINSLGFKKDDLDGSWTKEYFRIREQIDQVLFEGDI